MGLKTELIDIRKSLEINTKRFEMSKRLTEIFENTIQELF